MPAKPYKRQEARTKKEARGKRPSAKSYGGGERGKELRARAKQEQSKARDKGQEPARQQSKELLSNTLDLGFCI